MIVLGRHRFDTDTSVLTDEAGVPVRLRNQSLRVLEYLVSRAGAVVGKDEIIAHVWPRTYVSDDSLSQCIKDIRRALGDTERTVLRTLPGRGFAIEARRLGKPEPGRLPTVVVDVPAGGSEGEEAGLVAGLIEKEIVAAIAGRTGIRVVRGTSPEGEIDYRITGRARMAGNSVEVAVEIDETSGRGIFYSKSFVMETETPLDFARHVARKVTNVQRVSAITHHGTRYLHHADDDLDLQQLLSKAAHYYSRITPEDTASARRTLESAVARYPESPMALAMLAATSVHLNPLVPIDRRPETVAWALDLAERAVYAGPHVDFTIRTRGNLKLWLLGDLDGAVADCRRALALTPNYQLAHLTVIQCELFSGDGATARRHLDEAIEVDLALPQYTYFQTLYALCALKEGEDGKARSHAWEAFEYSPWSDWSALVYAVAHADAPDDMPGAVRERLGASRLTAGHFRDLPIRDEAFLGLLVERARAGGAAP